MSLKLKKSIAYQPVNFIHFISHRSLNFKLPNILIIKKEKEKTTFIF